MNTDGTCNNTDEDVEQGKEDTQKKGVKIQGVHYKSLKDFDDEVRRAEGLASPEHPEGE